MAIEISELNQLQSDYKSAVEEWIAAIRHDESLASAATHSETRIDEWEEAGVAEEAAREHAKAAKSAYEEALRQEFFNF